MKRLLCMVVSIVILLSIPLSNVNAGELNTQTELADVYKKYYSEEISKEMLKLQGDISKDSQLLVQTRIKKLMDKCFDINTLAQENKITGSILPVPLHGQTETLYSNGSNLCWAACKSMWISYILGDDVNRVEEIAIAVSGSKSPSVYNHARKWVSLNMISSKENDPLNVTQRQDYLWTSLTKKEIREELNNLNPFCTVYGDTKNGEWRGHIIMTIGYVEAPGHQMLIISNDPFQPIQRIQTEVEFRGNYVEDKPQTRPWRHTVISI